MIGLLTSGCRSTYLHMIVAYSVKLKKVTVGLVVLLGFFLQLCEETVVVAVVYFLRCTCPSNTKKKTTVLKIMWKFLLQNF